MVGFIFGGEADPQKYVDLVFTRYYKNGLIVFVCAYVSVGIGWWRCKESRKTARLLMGSGFGYRGFTAAARAGAPPRAPLPRLPAPCFHSRLFSFIPTKPDPLPPTAQPAALQQRRDRGGRRSAGPPVPSNPHLSLLSKLCLLSLSLE